MHLKHTLKCIQLYNIICLNNNILENKFSFYLSSSFPALGVCRSIFLDFYLIRSPKSSSFRCTRLIISLSITFYQLIFCFFLTLVLSTYIYLFNLSYSLYPSHLNKKRNRLSNIEEILLEGQNTIIKLIFY